MKRILLSILAILFPWIVILLEGRFIAAMACLALQLTFIGWIPASIWALKAAKRVELQENNVDITESPAETQVDMPEKAETPAASPQVEAPPAAAPQAEAPQTETPQTETPQTIEQPPVQENQVPQQSQPPEENK